MLYIYICYIYIYIYILYLAFILSISLAVNSFRSDNGNIKTNLAVLRSIYED